MNAVKGLTKVVVCGSAAFALTVASSWALVTSNSVAHFATDMPTVVILARAEVAKVGVVRLAQAR
jgi:hypothetical protein